MTEIEFLHEMVKAAGGNPDMLKDKLKSTYYECIINCLNNGGGSGSGSTGGGDGKYIYGVMDGDTAVFSMTGAEILALGEDVRNYEIVLVDGTEIYRVTQTRVFESGMTFDFINVYKNYVKQRFMSCSADGTIKINAAERTQLPDIPLPNGLMKDQILVSNTGEYKWIDVPFSNNPLLQAVDMNGTLVTVQTKPLMELVTNATQTGNVHTNLIVLKDMITDTVGNTSAIYRLAKVDSISSATDVYGIFTNGIDKNIKMDAAGNFTYMD